MKPSDWKEVDQARQQAAPPTQPVEEEADEYKGDERILKRVVATRIRTLKQLAAACDIDLSEWEIYRWKCGTWTTGMKPPAVGATGAWKRRSGKPIYSRQYVVMAWMKLKRNVIAAKNEIEELRKKAINYRPHPPVILIRKAQPGLMCEFSATDHHFGALIWGKETLWPDYDRHIAKYDWEAAFTTLIGRTRDYRPERVLLVLGNDQQNIDNRAGATEAGTPQNSDSRYQKIFAISRDASIWAIDALASITKHVDVIMVPGNHDYLATWHLGDSLHSWFRKSKHISIDYSEGYRKYYRHGVTMLMFTHGNKGKLEEYDKTMAAERPDMWGATKWREAHTGDKHHRRVIELKGATVRILPSLRPPDSWSSENHLIGSLRAAEAYVWDAREGLVGTAVYSILDQRKEQTD